jgi:peptidyl-prolyl cis-trans isomerase SDCCAG10
LNGKATLFGRIVGDTIFNLLRMSEMEIDPKTEAPLYPPVILKTEVILNPFDDIIPRERRIEVAPSDLVSEEKTTVLKKKNLSLLSFADEEESNRSTKGNNIQDKVKPSPSPSPSPSQSQSSTITASSTIKTASSLQFLQQMNAAQMRATQDKIKLAEEELGFRPKATPEREIKSSNLKEKQQEKETSSSGSMTALERYKAKFSENRKRQKPVESSNNEMDTLLLLNSFRQKIKKSSDEPSDAVPSEIPEPKHLDICKLHGLLNCLSCRDTFNIKLDTSELDEKDWMLHKLVFDRREIEGKVRADLKDLVVIDPREQAEELKNKSKNKL